MSRKHPASPASRSNRPRNLIPFARISGIECSGGVSRVALDFHHASSVSIGLGGRMYVSLRNLNVVLCFTDASGDADGGATLVWKLAATPPLSDFVWAREIDKVEHDLSRLFDQKSSITWLSRSKERNARERATRTAASGSWRRGCRARPAKAYAAEHLRSEGGVGLFWLVCMAVVERVSRGAGQSLSTSRPSRSLPRGSSGRLREAKRPPSLAVHADTFRPAKRDRRSRSRTRSLPRWYALSNCAAARARGDTARSPRPAAAAASSTRRTRSSSSTTASSR